MTGTILRVNTKAGFIQADHGPILYFRRSSVLDPGFDALDTGHPVSFDIDSDNRRIAVEVLRHFEWGPDNPPLENGGAPPQLRYLGYEQEGSTRSYRFAAVREGRLVTFIIDADLKLLTARRVRLQEAAELCRRALESTLTAEDWAATTPRRHVLESHHLD